MIKTISSKLVFRNKYGYELFEDKVEFPNGEGTYHYLKHKLGFVAICAFDGVRLYLIRNFRYPIKKDIWELPKGYIGEGENPLAAAKRELKEETGVVAKKWTKIGVYQALPGFVDMKGHLYLATDLEMKKAEVESDEMIKRCKKFKPDEVKSIDLLTNYAVEYLRNKK